MYQYVITYIFLNLYLQKLMLRHPNLAIRIPERVSRARAGIDVGTLNLWFQNLE